MVNSKREILNIPLDDLAFDKQNPRLPQSFDSRNEEKEIITWLIENAKLLELMDSISTNGFFNGEPLLGYKENNKFVVVEGNRRLGAVKLLNDPGLVDIRKNAIANLLEEALVPPPEEIPFIEYGDREEILQYLGYRHITGVKSWGALAKARYLDQLKKTLLSKKPDLKTDDQAQFKILAKEIGTNSNYVARLLTGLNLYNVIEQNNYFDISGLDEKTFNFSLLTTAISYVDLCSFLNLQGPKDIYAESLDAHALSRLIYWMFHKNDAGHTMLEDSRNLSELSEIVKNEEALKSFDSGEMNIHQAIRLTGHPLKIVTESLDEVLNLLKITQQYSAFARNVDETHLERVINTADLLRSIHITLKSKIENQSDPFDVGD